MDKDLFLYDAELRKEYGVICGIDEAGRGSLAGDVYAAAVVFDEGVFIDGLNDSKKLSEKKREIIYDEIILKARAYCVASASIAEIEELNILQASLLAMERAVKGLSIRPDLTLADGNKAPRLDCKVQTIVKGDGISASIAAASVLAKVSRDRYMKKLTVTYPQYQFERHKGYGTKLHYELIREYGKSEVHRPSFLKSIKI